MSEQAPKTHEQERSHEAKLAKHEQQEKLKQTVESGKETKHEAKDALETIRQSIEKEAASSKHTKQEQHKHEQKDEGPGQIVIDRNVKNKAYKKELHRVQAHLPKAQRSFSKFVHSRSVEAVSEVSSKTVARPSGLLGGGLVALLGTSALVIISRHYGFTYNFFVFLALLAGGFVVGLLGELLIRGFFKLKS